jgi:hypothetical protein
MKAKILSELNLKPSSFVHVYDKRRNYITVSTEHEVVICKINDLSNRVALKLSKELQHKRSIRFE